VSPDDTFIELGGDSIAAVMCLSAIEARTGAVVSIETLLGSTVRELGEALAGGFSARVGHD
jgi:acyl carrier protein